MISSTSPVDIRPDHLEIVEDILREHLPAGFKVWAFGSRANWTTKDASDLDLAVEGPDALDYKAMVELEVAFEESDLPYTVDVVDLNAVSQEFKRIVEAQRIPLPPTAPRRASGEWRKVALGDVCAKIGSGATPKGGKDVYLEEGSYTLIRSQNVYNGGFHRDGLVFISENHADALQNVEVIEKDVLLNITGDSVARVCQVATDVLPARVNQHVAIIRPDSDSLDAGYLRYYLASPEMQTLLLSWAGSGGTRNALTKAMLESLEIPLPPLPEQRAIAHVLGALDDKIELNRRMNRTLEEMAGAIFQDWFVDFGPTRAKMDGQEPYLPPELWDLFPNRLVPSQLGEIPQGWNVGTISQLSERIYNGGTPKRSEPSYWEGGQIPWLTSGEVRQSFVLGTQNFISEEGLAKSSAKMVPERSILVALYGATAGQVSMNYRPLATNQAVSAIIPDPESRFFCLIGLKLQESSLGNRAVGSAQQNISKKTVEQTPVLLPRIELRSVYNDLVEQLFDQVFRNLDESNALSAQRDALLPKLVSGEVRVRETSFT